MTLFETSECDNGRINEVYIMESTVPQRSLTKFFSILFDSKVLSI